MFPTVSATDSHRRSFFVDGALRRLKVQGEHNHLVPG